MMRDTSCEENQNHLITEKGDNKDDEMWHGSGVWRCVRCGMMWVTVERLLEAEEELSRAEAKIEDPEPPEYDEP